MLGAAFLLPPGKLGRIPWDLSHARLRLDDTPGNSYMEAALAPRTLAQGWQTDSGHLEQW